jgi:hypothetical protein
MIKFEDDLSQKIGFSEIFKRLPSLLANAAKILMKRFQRCPPAEVEKKDLTTGGHALQALGIDANSNVKSSVVVLAKMAVFHLAVALFGLIISKPK